MLAKFSITNRVAYRQLANDAQSDNVETKPARLNVEVLVRIDDFETTSKNCYLYEKEVA
jgi:hypothetical protein